MHDDLYIYFIVHMGSNKYVYLYIIEYVDQISICIYIYIDEHV